MITVPEVVEELVKQQPFIEEGLSKGLINLSSLARELQPTIQQRLFKDIKIGAIVMALKRMRLQTNYSESNVSSIFKDITDLSVRSNIIYYTFANSPTLLKREQKLLEKLSFSKNVFLTFTQGVFETALFASAVLKPEIEEVFAGEALVFKRDELSSITVILPKETVDVPGVYYSILKILAWNGINFVEVVSSFTELTIFMDSKSIDKAFSALKQLGNKNS